jgi:hypothetical protein
MTLQKVINWPYKGRNDTTKIVMILQRSYKGHKGHQLILQRSKWPYKVGQMTYKGSLQKLCTKCLSRFLLQGFILFTRKWSGEMVQLFPRGPYDFCGHWWRFVSRKFRTRYCGHTLSRLAEIRHNMTKQTRFPTIRENNSEKQFVPTLLVHNIGGQGASNLWMNSLNRL